MVYFLKAYTISKLLRDKLATLLMGFEFNFIGSRSVISLPFRSGNVQRISIGKGVFVGPNCWIQVIGDSFSNDEPVIALGDDISISGDCTITAVNKVTIGSGALIARFVHISDHSHATENPDMFIRLQGTSKVAAVSIGEGAWLGHGVVVCPGVTIGRNAVIGANSVVLEDVPDYCVAVGAPAKIVRRPSPSVVSSDFQS